MADRAFRLGEQALAAPETCIAHIATGRHGKRLGPELQFIPVDINEFGLVARRLIRAIFLDRWAVFLVEQRRCHADVAVKCRGDLLLHDMGEELADGRPEFKAGPRDWRTPPLWGSGLSQSVSGSTAMLHDGRARNVTEAILWHGGEAQSAREAFRNMPKADREALLKFLSSI